MITECDQLEFFHSIKAMKHCLHVYFLMSKVTGLEDWNKDSLRLCEVSERDKGRVTCCA